MSLQLQNIERLHLGLLALMAGIAALTPSLSPWSVLLGGAVMGLNFWVMRQLAGRLLTGGTQRRTGVIVALAVVKFSIFLALLGVVFRQVPIDAMSFAVGATVLLVACVVEALRTRPALS